MHTAPSLLKLKNEFHNSKLDSAEKDTNEWISYFEELRILMSKFGVEGNIMDEDFMIHIYLMSTILFLVAWKIA